MIAYFFAIYYNNGNFPSFLTVDKISVQSRRLKASAVIAVTKEDSNEERYVNAYSTGYMRFVPIFLTLREVGRE